MADEMLDYAAAAAVTGLKVGTLYSMVSKKQIPHVRITSRLVRFPRRELENWIRARLVLPTSAPESPSAEPRAPKTNRKGRPTLATFRMPPRWPGRTSR